MVENQILLLPLARRCNASLYFLVLKAVRVARFTTFFNFKLQVVEHCCSNTNIMLGETLPGVSKDMDLTSYKVPLGVCAGIAPFNFPAMIPLW